MSFHTTATLANSIKQGYMKNTGIIGYLLKFFIGFLVIGILLSITAQALIPGLRYEYIPWKSGAAQVDVRNPETMITPEANKEYARVIAITQGSYGITEDDYKITLVSVDLDNNLAYIQVSDPYGHTSKPMKREINEELEIGKTSKYIIRRYTNVTKDPVDDEIVVELFTNKK